MTAIQIHPSDHVDRFARREAERIGMSVEQLCTNIVTDEFVRRLLEATGETKSLALLDRESSRAIAHRATVEAESYQFVPLKEFSVATNFKGYPSRSIEYAQAVLEEIRDYDGVEVAKVRSGIGVKPNFVFVESLLKQSGRYGIRVSFYNRNGAIMKAAPKLMKPGQGNYCRCLVESAEILEQIRPLIRMAYDLKFGKTS